jgi:murein DD-endopeptidase MepM/ murein hydrolase activator NlpD
LDLIQAARSRGRVLIACGIAILVGAALLVYAGAEKRRLQKTQVAQSLALRAEIRSMEARLPVWRRLAIPPHSTFASVLESANISPEVAAKVIAAAKPVYNLGLIRAGNNLSVLATPQGALTFVRYRIDADRRLEIKATNGGYDAKIEPIVYETKLEKVEGTIEDSLFGAIESLHEQDALALRMADIFGWDLDFYTDPQPGDRFAVWVEKKYLHGQLSGYGKIVAAEYVNAGRPYEAILFHDAEGLPAYYRPDGKPLKREFLRSPLKFAVLRVTSRFSYHRFHPILKTYRAHLGVDYGAPIGTPVQAIGSGAVIAAGWAGEGGREIAIRHPNGYETKYMHLSRILVRRGQHVGQGQTIGRVGMSGLATGPHLDFRIIHNGRYENFEVVRRNLPPAQPVAAADRAAFEKLCDEFNPGLNAVLAEARAAKSAKSGRNN